MLPDRKCKMIVGLWTLGMNGECFHPNAGVRLGRHGIKRFAIQVSVVVAGGGDRHHIVTVSIPTVALGYVNKD